MQKIAIQFYLSLKAKVNIVLIMNMHADFLYYFMSWIKEPDTFFESWIFISWSDIFFILLFQVEYSFEQKGHFLGLMGSVLINTKTYETRLDFT